MPKLHTTLEPGDVILIPPGSGASIKLLDKTGRRSRIEINSDAPVTIDKARAGATNTSGVMPPIARRPVPPSR